MSKKKKKKENKMQPKSRDEADILKSMQAAIKEAKAKLEELKELIKNGIPK